MKKKVSKKLERSKLLDLSITGASPLYQTVCFYMCAKERKEFDYLDALRLKEAIGLLQLHDRRGNPIRGLFRQLPGVDTIRVDRYTVLAAVCTKILSKNVFKTFSRGVAWYGWVHAYSYDNVKPRRFTFEGRLSLSDIYVVTQLAGLQIPPLCYISFCWKKFWESHYKKQETKTHLMNWLIFKNIGHKCYNKWIYDFWKYMMKRRYSKAQDMFAFRYGRGGALDAAAEGIEF